MGEREQNLSLQDHEVHIWCISLDVPRDTQKRMEKLLSNDEGARARRFRCDRDRERWTAGRATLRQILSRYVGSPPGLLRFSHSTHGKPDLLEQFGDDAPAFSMSRSAEYALCAIARRGPIGVDLERVCDGVMNEDLVQSRFAREEITTLAAVPACRRVSSFYQLWTLKEAYVKARGIGFGLPLDRFAVVQGSRGKATLIRADGDPRPGLWDLRALAVPPGYRGAVAAALAHAGSSLAAMRLHYFAV